MLFWNTISCGSRQYAKVVAVSKVPLPNYRSDLDDKRPQREVFYNFYLFCIPCFFILCVNCRTCFYLSPLATIALFCVWQGVYDSTLTEVHQYFFRVLNKCHFTLDLSFASLIHLSYWQVILPFGLQREVDLHLRSFLSQKARKSDNFTDKSFLRTSSGGKFASDGGSDMQQDPFMQNSAVMDRVLRRRSLQIRNKQQEWQVSFLFLSLGFSQTTNTIWLESYCLFTKIYIYIKSVFCISMFYCVCVCSVCQLARHNLGHSIFYDSAFA